MHAARAWLPRPDLGSRFAVGVLTLLSLVPLLLRLPRVSVVACFDVGHPLYEWVPTTAFNGDVQCVSAPTPVVSWTLVIAATLLVQVLLLPILLAIGGLLVRGTHRVLASTGRVLASVLSRFVAVFVPDRHLVPVPVRVHHPDAVWTRQNPRRGPPSASC